MSKTSHGVTSLCKRFEAYANLNEQSGSKNILQEDENHIKEESNRMKHSSEHTLLQADEPNNEPSSHATGQENATVHDIRTDAETEEDCVEGAHGSSSIQSDSSECDPASEGWTSVENINIDRGNGMYRTMLSSPDSAMDAYYTTDTSAEECALCNAENTEYMVEVYMSILQRNLDVAEILPLLHFINHNDARMLSKTEPQEDAVKKLLDIITNDTEDSGKWTTFLVALEKAGYTYLHQLLTGETEKDHFYTNSILSIMKPALINQIYLRDIIDLMIEKSLINEEDQDQIESVEKVRGPIAATRVLLEKVDKRSPNWDTEFAEILEKSGMSEIANIFKMVEHHDNCENKEDDNPKKKRQKTLKRKFGRAGRCRTHSQMKTQTLHLPSEEQKSKRIKQSIEQSSKTSESVRQVTNDEMIGLTASLLTLNMNVENLKQNMIDIKEAMTATQAITRMHNDNQITVLTQRLIETSEEQSLVKQQVSEQNQTLKYLSETVASLGKHIMHDSTSFTDQSTNT
ncbi:uncharacterized protein LOC123538906 isoform X2 [Mercenaria mercenaria]|uniref:uncharacterized protein LOC123538906 isoform X2 n=1 Tax=Mercenaria mercenaria TaxID=6596 RepID=UPI00234F2446|nr:uncharacterized protein LOC123538906 isoform X2 [Mercenaria mercenaria]